MAIVHLLICLFEGFWDAVAVVVMLVFNIIGIALVWFAQVILVNLAKVFITNVDVNNLDLQTWAIMFVALWLYATHSRLKGDSILS